MDIVESAPHNYSHFGKYEGVGAHLFAIACQISVEAGCDGYVAFESKTGLIEHYDRGRYDVRATYELVVKLGRPLTEEEYEKFRIDGR